MENAPLPIFHCMLSLPQGILFTTAECLKTPMDMVRLWIHEASRVYGDKLIEAKDIDNFAKLKFDVAKANFEVGVVMACTVQAEGTQTAYTYWWAGVGACGLALKQ